VRDTASVELIILLPIAVIPLVVMASRRRWTIGGVAMWLAGLGFLALWMVALWRDMDGVDATGESGSILAGFGWVIAACATAACSVFITGRRTDTVTKS
jgi:hypothetical protein